MPTQAILFDLDETLVTDGAATAAALVATVEFARLSGVDTQALAHAVFRVAHEAWRHSPHMDYFQQIGISAGECLWGRFIGEDPRLMPIRAWAPEYQLGCWTEGLASFGVRDEVLSATLAERYRIERRARHDWLFPETLATLEALAPHYQLGLITNGAPDIQRDKLNGSGLAQFFSVVQVSGEFGMGKPDPAIFENALDLLGCSATDAVMIGDNPARDILGANNAGIRAVWIRRQNAKLTPGACPDATIASLTELESWLPVN